MKEAKARVFSPVNLGNKLSNIQGRNPNLVHTHVEPCQLSLARLYCLFCREWYGCLFSLPVRREPNNNLPSRTKNVFTIQITNWNTFLIIQTTSFVSQYRARHTGARYRNNNIQNGISCNFYIYTTLSQWRFLYIKVLKISDIIKVLHQYFSPSNKLFLLGFQESESMKLQLRTPFKPYLRVIQSKVSTT